MKGSSKIIPSGCVVALAALAFGTACADLSPIDPGQCGNGVLDAGEDCDGFVDGRLDVDEAADARLGRGMGCATPSEVAACHYVCDVERACPAAWDCGRDGVCRSPSRELRESEVGPDWTPDSFVPVDFDDDGNVDVVGTFTNSIEFRRGVLGGTLDTAAVVTSLPATGPVATGPVDSDRYGDVLVPTAQGMLIRRGRADGIPLESAWSGRTIPGDFPAILLGATHQARLGAEKAVIAVLDASESSLLVLISSGGVNLAVQSLLVPWRVRDLGSRLPRADFDGDGGDDYPLGFRGASEVLIYGIVQDLLNGSLGFHSLPGAAGAALSIAEPLDCKACSGRLHGMQVAGGVLGADVDGDGDQDLLVSVTDASGGSEATLVALNEDGLGGFGDPYVDHRFDLLAVRSELVGLPGALPHWPLLAADLDGDQIADFVDPHGVVLAQPDGAALIAGFTPPTPGSWTSALAADLDGDGDDALDIVAFQDGQSFVDVLLCAHRGESCRDDGQYRTKRFQTSRGVVAARAGYLRGGAAMDVAIVERGPDAASEGDLISVLYGRPNDLPEERVEQSRVRRVEHLDVGSVDALDGNQPDVFDDVFVTLGDPGAAREYVFLHGTSETQLTSPYRLPPPLSLPLATVRGRAAVLGDFSGRGEPFDDLVFFGSSVGDEPFVYGVPGAENAALPPSPDGTSLAEALGPDFDLGCARFASGDVDGDGRDEVVLIHGRAICPNAADTGVVLIRYGEAGELAFETAPLDVGGLTGGAALQVADTDGDGRADVLLAAAGVLLRYGGSPTGLAPTPSTVALPAGETVTGVVALARSAGARGRGRIAVLTTTSLVVFDKDGASTTVGRGGRSLHSVDVDADGLGDLLVQAEDGLYALRTVPAPSLGGE